MERMEIIGLGAAVMGHAGLLGAFYLGLFPNDEKPPQQPSISVNLVADIADVSTAPDAIQEESAPLPEEVEDIIEEAIEEPVPEPKANDKPVVIKKKEPPRKEKPKDKPKKRAEKKPTKKKTARAKKPRAFSKDFTSSFDGKGKAEGTPASKTAAEVKRSIKVSLSSQVERFFKRCAPSGIDVNKITTAATLNLNKGGGLISITGLNQRGVNASNKTQAPLHKECVQNAIKRAAPFKNLPEDNYAVWKRWPMEFNTK